MSVFKALICSPSIMKVPTLTIKSLTNFRCTKHFVKLIFAQEKFNLIRNRYVKCTTYLRFHHYEDFTNNDGKADKLWMHKKCRKINFIGEIFYFITNKFLTNMKTPIQ